MKTSKKVLIIEDELVLSTVYKTVLTYGGYDVDIAGNGKEGLEKVETFKPDLILLDILMPIMDGITFLKQFDFDSYNQTKIVVYSNLFDAQTVEQVKSLGAEDIALKSSLSPQDLLVLIAGKLD